MKRRFVAVGPVLSRSVFCLAMMAALPGLVQAQPFEILTVDCDPFVSPDGIENTMGMAITQCDSSGSFNVTEVTPTEFRTLTPPQLSAFDAIVVNNDPSRLGDDCVSGAGSGLGTTWHDAVGITTGGCVVLTSHDPPAYHVLFPPFSTPMSAACPGCEPFGACRLIEQAVAYAAGGAQTGLVIFNEEPSVVGGVGWDNPELNLPPAWNISDLPQFGGAAPNGGYTEIRDVFVGHPMYAGLNDLRLTADSISSFAHPFADGSFHTIFNTFNHVIFDKSEQVVNSGVSNPGNPPGCCSGTDADGPDWQAITLIRQCGTVWGCGDRIVNSPEECDPPAPTANPDCCQAHASPGCSDPTCEGEVCAIDSYCCGDTCDCCTAHAGLGCSELSCEVRVCDVEPACCGVEWDAACAGIALEFPECEHCCAGVWDGLCADKAVSQLDTCVRRCTDPGECTAECCWDSDGDGICDSLGDSCIFGPNQGGEALFPTVRAVEQCDCCDPHPGDTGCSNPSCEASVCDINPFCCDFEWTPACAAQAAANPKCDECCAPQTFWWVNPVDYQVVRGGFEASWEIGGYVEDLFTSGSGNSYVDQTPLPPDVGLWYLWEPICPDSSWSSGGAGEIACQPPSDCCDPHNPNLPDPAGCNEAACESIVCGIDPYCCGQDPSCDCCTSHATAGCVDPTCTNNVCTMDPDCCSPSGWNADCVALAKTLTSCNLCCGYWNSACEFQAEIIETCINGCNGELCRSQPTPLP